MTMSEANAMPRTRFVEEFGWVFEESSWVAGRASVLRPFTNVDALHAAMVQQVEAATHPEQLALLRAHPDLGTRVRLSAASTGEQSGAGLDSLTQEEYDRLRMLNTEYRDRFGFPFLFAVKGSTKYDILNALERRRHAALEDELREALNQVYRIASFRLQDIFRVGSRD